MMVTIYEQDFYSWTQQQAQLLKNRQFTEIDVDNLVEEIESMGRSEKRELESRLVVLLAHLLKWQYQPTRRGKSWYLTIKGQRANCQDVLNDNPSLKSKLADIFNNAYAKAKIEAAKETDLDETNFPTECPYTLTQTFSNDFYPENL